MSEVLGYDPRRSEESQSEECAECRMKNNQGLIVVLSGHCKFYTPSVLY